jgi:hypothetical protein
VKDAFNFTLYEFFGYLIPGWVAGAALGILLWAIFSPDFLLPLTFWRISPAAWLAITFLGYMLGHPVQALGNKILEGADHKILSNDRNPVVKYAKCRAASLSGAVVEDADETWLYRVMDEFCMQFGHPGDREIFTYREGFYRGACLSLTLLTTAILLRMVRGAPTVQIGDSDFLICQGELAFAAVVAATSVWACRFRFQRFSEYRVGHVVSAFVALQAPTHPDSKEAGPHA